MILQNLVIYFVYLFYPLLIPLPLTVVHATVAVVAAASMYHVDSSPSLLYIVFVLGSIPSQPQNHRGESCVSFLLMRLIWCV